MEHFNELVVQYTPMIHKIMRTLHIYKNHEEFYQTGLIGLWEAQLNFDPSKGSFANYAYTSIKGKMLVEMNQSNKHEERIIYPKEEFWSMIEDVNPESLLEMETLLTYCEGLTEKETKWVIANYKDCLSIKDIAKTEKVSISAVKQWRVGALRKLREQVEMQN
ncbi:sigma-70 family RNA polymerase sigma factor [Neobacillus sp. 3P2-tot-E-2]|uniref:sigma-70 family RNA polymerase sigma factor n=1 Tax=Neobacillus sp. 3P2-tot-E-2 TaxID=3132212 RepID=UPI00399F16D9